MQAAMVKKRRHSRAEIATKLAQANELATRGKLQSEIARTLGVSIMTLHRWRKASHEPQPAQGVAQPNGACCSALPKGSGLCLPSIPDGWPGHAPGDPGKSRNFVPNMIRCHWAPLMTAPAFI